MWQHKTIVDEQAALPIASTISTLPLFAFVSIHLNGSCVSVGSPLNLSTLLTHRLYKPSASLIKGFASL